MEIELGEYVRTNDGIIDKVIIKYTGKCNNPNCNEKHVSCKKNYYNEENIVSHSKNIKDLIQLGDYVNGHYIYEILEDGRLHTLTGILLDNEDIKSILTKEQYEANSYVVEREE